MGLCWDDAKVLGAGFWQDLCPPEGPTLELPLPKGLSSMERAHPVPKWDSPSREGFGELCPTGAGAECEQEGAVSTMNSLQPHSLSPCPMPSANRSLFPKTTPNSVPALWELPVPLPAFPICSNRP